jgi:TalC/MipB family fructose-6-phosphate aldolase
MKLPKCQLLNLFGYKFEKPYSGFMEIWLNTVDIETIQKARKLGILSGIITNSAIIAHSGQSLEEVLRSLLKVQTELIAVQVTASNAQSIIEQAETLHDFSEKIIIKIPVTEEGLKAILSLSHLQIPTMATAVFTPIQTLLACKAGANYIVPYFSQIESEGRHPVEVLSNMIDVVEFYNFHAKIIAASLKTEDHFMCCLQVGVYGVTLDQEMFQLITKDAHMTLKSIETFAKKWETAKPSRLL